MNQILTEEEMQALYTTWPTKGWPHEYRKVEAAVLAKLREQNEPVAEVVSNNRAGMYDELPIGTLLYTNPAPIPIPIPEGWQLVPKLSDYKMNDAGVDAFKSRSTIGKFCGFDWRDAEAIYIAMLAAARSGE